MFNSVWEDIKREFKFGNVLIRLIFFNFAVFILVSIVALIYIGIYGTDTGRAIFESTILHPWLCASYEWKHILFKPWTIFTSMFLHVGVRHVAWNMIFLYWFGRIFRDFTMNRGHDMILPVYVLGGLVGFVAYVISGLLFPEAIGKYALGASAGVMAIVFATAALAPRYQIHLFFFSLELRYIALILIALDLLFIDNNTGGHVAHLGGAFMGWFFIEQLNKGNDMAIPFNRIIDRIKGFGARIKDFFQGKRRPKVVYKNPKGTRTRGNTKTDANASSRPNQEYIDSILEKIKRSGYKSLTQEEREALFRASDK